MAGVAEFVPTDITGLVWWLKADSGTYLDAAKTQPATSNNDSVYTWDDQSSANMDAVQATASARPLLILNAQNGLPVLRFTSAASKYLATALQRDALSNITVYLVVKGANTTSGYAVSFGNSGNAVIHDYTATKWEWYSSPRTVIGTTSTSIYQGVSTALGSTILGTWKINTDGAANFSSEDIGEVLVYNSALAVEDDTKVKNYLVARWNLPPF